jgi:UDP-2,3-diacylglucosamine pyrophosphatase LpxH
MNTLIVSDIHLGSPNSQAPLLSRLLQADFDRLILNGDTVNGLNFKKFQPKHWRIVSQLREIARKRELILIRGNHDGHAAVEGHFGPFDVLATLLGVELLEEYRIEAGDRKYLVLHGDRFDPTLNWPLLTDAADWCYQTTQKVNRRVAKWLKRRVKTLGGVVELVKRNAVEYARARGFQGVITGHSHFSDDELIEGMHFLNTGCWVDRPCTYVVAGADGVQLHSCDESTAVFATCPTAGLRVFPEAGHAESWQDGEPRKVIAAH